MSNKLVIWDSASVPNAVVLGDNSEFENPWELRKGVSRINNWPADFHYKMNPDFPHDTLLVDNLINTHSTVVVSPKLRAFLEARGVKKVEYLPVTILDHRGRPASQEYCIVHPIDPVDCLDLAASQPHFSAIDKTTIQRVKKLVVDEARLDPEREFFRAKGFGSVTFATRALAEAVSQAKFVGVRWKELASHH